MDLTEILALYGTMATARAFIGTNSASYYYTQKLLNGFFPKTPEEAENEWKKRKERNKVINIAYHVGSLGRFLAYKGKRE